jgi:hypothetical protein
VLKKLLKEMQKEFVKLVVLILMLIQREKQEYVNVKPLILREIPLINV